MSVCKGVVIGRVVDVDLGSFLWEIPGFSGLPKEEGIYFSSPSYIHLAETWWILYIFPNGSYYFPDQILLRLCRCDSGPEKTFHCTVGVRRAGGEEEEVGTQTVKIESGKSVSYKFDKGAKDCEEGDWLFSGTLTLTLRIKEEGEATSQGGLLNCKETQTEGLNCRCGRQNCPSEEEGSSSEAKDKTSREIQTDVLGNTTDRQGDSTPPEAKGIVLLSKHIKELLDKRDDCDVRFRVQNKEFPAHRNILKARCPVFRMMLTHDSEENKSGIIRIEDCDADAFEIFLKHMYSGKAEDLTPQKALNLYYIADKYDFSELKEQCVALLKGSLSKTTVCDVILLSAKHGESELMEAATKFFIENIKEIIVTVEWQNFMIKHPIEGNELYIKYVNIVSKQ